MVDSNEFLFDELKGIQYSLAADVKIQPLTQKPRYIGGFDTAPFGNDGGIGVLSIFEHETRDIIEEVVVKSKYQIPYKSSYLGFREVPLFKEAWENCQNLADVVAFDGHGIAHPRGLGLAAHAGVTINIPTFGIAKNPSFGSFTEPEQQRGSWTPIMNGERTIGATLRTQDNTKPVYVSVGNKITLEELIEITLHFSKYRIPELTRIPDLRGKQ